MSQLQHSMFHEVFFPTQKSEQSEQDLFLSKLLRFQAPENAAIREQTLVIFDFETTGLDSKRDQIIEIGALRVEKGVVTDEFSSLIQVDQKLDETIVKITGITDEMLEGQPRIEEVLGAFLDFIQGAILVAHNADFDMGFLRSASEKQGYQLDWPCFCTLKMARQVLPELESKNLDTLAKHYGLEFEARHRSIGDCKVTSAVLQGMLAEQKDNLRNWEDLKSFAVS